MNEKAFWVQRIMQVAGVTGRKRNKYSSLLAYRGLPVALSTLSWNAILFFLLLPVNLWVYNVPTLIVYLKDLYSDFHFGVRWY